MNPIERTLESHVRQGNVCAWEFVSERNGIVEAQASWGTIYKFAKVQWEELPVIARINPAWLNAPGTMVVCFLLLFTLTAFAQPPLPPQPTNAFPRELKSDRKSLVLQRQLKAKSDRESARIQNETAKELSAAIAKYRKANEIERQKIVEQYPFIAWSARLGTLPPVHEHKQRAHPK